MLHDHRPTLPARHGVVHHPAPPMRAPARLLLLAPDTPERAHWCQRLRQPGHEVAVSADPAQICDAPHQGWDLLLLDPRVGAPAQPGAPVQPGHGQGWLGLQRLRQRHHDWPVGVVLHRADSRQRCLAFEMGADAVFDTLAADAEWQAQARSLLRPGGACSGDRAAVPLQVGRWRLDLARRRLEVPDGPQLPLSATECRLLQAVLEDPTRAIAREALIDLLRDADAQQAQEDARRWLLRLRRESAAPTLSAYQAPGVLAQARLAASFQGVGRLFDLAGIDRDTAA